jgi:hypothetical protein
MLFGEGGGVPVVDSSVLVTFCYVFRVLQRFVELYISIDLQLYHLPCNVLQKVNSLDALANFMIGLANAMSTDYSYIQQIIKNNYRATSHISHYIFFTGVT